MKIIGLIVAWILLAGVLCDAAVLLGSVVLYARGVDAAWPWLYTSLLIAIGSGFLAASLY